MYKITLLLGLAAGAYAQFNCVEDGFYVDPQQCDKYYECRRGEYTEKLCPDGLVFDDTLGPRVDQCKYPFQAICPEGKTMQKANPSGVECPRQYGRFEHEDPTNCAEYYECVMGVATKRKCHDGLYFDEFEGRCDWATKDFRQGCVEQREVLPDGFYCPRNESQSQAGVPDRDHQLYIHPDDCRSFYICYDGIKPALSGCADGTVFNEFTLVCDDPANVAGCEDYYGDRVFKKPALGGLSSPNAANAARRPAQPRATQA